MRSLFLSAAALALGAATAGSACAQGGTLGRRMTGTANGAVQFHFASREDACGDGERFYRIGDDTWYGTMINTSDPLFRASCVRGPVRVVATFAEREVVRLETFVGPLRAAPGATDLGAVSAREASAWLLRLAATADGRPAREALVAGVLADSAAVTSALLGIARDTDRPRETRRSAISWLARAADARESDVTRALVALARDERDAQPVRQSALAALLRVPQGAGLPALTELAIEQRDTWLGREAMRSVARSGDPRARDFLRRAVADRRLPDELRAAAITGLGGDLATGNDARLLRDTYRTLDGEKSRDATLTAVAAIGGAPNVEWLMGVARDGSEPSARRRRAIGQLARAGASGAQLAALYDRVDDTDGRVAVIAAMQTDGSKASREKLIVIARSTELTTVRRRAISALERLDGDDVREALSELAGARP